MLLVNGVGAVKVKMRSFSYSISITALAIVVSLLSSTVKLFALSPAAGMPLLSLSSVTIDQLQLVLLLW